MQTGNLTKRLVTDALQNMHQTVLLTAGFKESVYLTVIYLYFYQ